MSGVTINNVKKAYGGFEILHGIDAEIQDGEFVVLVGPSGCGKSTLLRMIAGLEGVTSGTIAIGDRVINEVHAKDRDIAMVFQNYALYPHMTVEQNMGFSLKLAGRKAPAIRTSVEQVAGFLGLSPLLRRYPRQLSGGQRQRVAMGRALVRNPKVFLFDEPLSNLDAKLRVQMRSEIKSLHRQFPTTAVYVTHDQVEAMTLADRIIVMCGGRIEQVGTPGELYEQPANLFVAGFIGSPAMNFLPGELADDMRSVLLGEQRVSVKAPGHAKPRQRVTVGFRPERIRFCDSGGIHFKVADVEFTGANSYVIGHIGREQICASVNGRTHVKAGQSASIAIDPASIHLFDTTTGKALV
ncbi:ABC transporter ATP-binding protein [Aestuariivirga sp. YIM B02566]|uniref:Sn-glycerol-3-phosphate ABC transporter ATP-binding protein UgpC n=1 Tax=Taklimakanibacter albus TaxID=2800327 RepID=A0ACC5R4W3_9HYPH|nr:sn-glycerol-3-phosphate ABC transporter ATP-binding protein UgpC [Aestuariivirga sp. YIM B02566]MBK1867633.1 sn-glycerol-3-phosphate ABC transporter ATP-binding protein UgpC [Aestuariivirga sp. YIM B02566]